MKKMTAVHLSLLGVILMISVGCVDPRIKREISLINVMTSTAAEEFKEAPDDAAKVKVADDFFQVAPKHTKVVDDYIFGRKPEAVKVE